MKRFFLSTGAQILIIPSVLSLVSIIGVDLLDLPGAALLVTIVFIVGAAVWVIGSLKRNDRTVMELSGSMADARHRGVAGLVMVVSDGDLGFGAASVAKDLEWLKSIPGFLCDMTNPDVVGLLMTDQSAKNAGLIRDILRRQRPELRVHQQRLPEVCEDDSIDLVQMERFMTSLIREVERHVPDNERIYVDITGGAKYHSVALYRSAEATSASLCYIAQNEDRTDRRLLLIAEPSDVGAFKR